MALGKYSRVDGRKPSSNYCWTVSVVGFVALCLVGVWMLTSSSVNPVENVGFPAEKEKSEVKETKEYSGSNTKQFEDTPGDLPEDAIKGDSNDSPNQEEKNNVEKPSEEKVEEKQEEKAEEKEEKEEKAEEKEEKAEEKEEKAEEKEEKAEEKEEEAEEKGENVEEKTKEDGDGAKSEEQKVSEEGSREAEQESTQNAEKKAEESSIETKEGDKLQQNTDENQDKDSDKSSDGKEDGKPTDKDSKEVFPSGAQSEILKETTTQGGSFPTQATESKKEKEVQTSAEPKQDGYSWKLCNTTAGPDFIPCLDNLDAISHLRGRNHYQHRERHCPAEAPTCLVPLRDGYKRPIPWPKSRDKIWFNNVPYTKLADIKGHQNWVKVSGEYLTFPGGGTQFKNGALHYIEFIEKIVSAQGIQFKWGKSPRVVLDVGCGVASFGGFLFDKDVITMSFAPKDEHEAQVQFALERGIPALSAVMGTARLPFPSIVFDVIHCARCRVPWHADGGKLLLELNRVLRPGGFFVWSATPVYQKLEEDVAIWKAMSKLTKSMCWELIAKEKDRVNGVGVAVYRKPSTNECYEKRSKSAPPICPQSDDPNAAWNVLMQSCLHKVPTGDSERGSQWPKQWPSRVQKAPYWLTSSSVGVYGKPAPEDFTADYEHWKRVISQSYLSGVGIDWSTVRNVMDMRAVYGGFAAALREMKIWVMNVVTIDSPDTLPIIYERGLFGLYHDWCESFSTYPRSYDLLHADHLFSMIKKKCSVRGLVAEVDRILRPEGKIIIRDNQETITELENMFRSMKWEIRMTYSKDNEGLLCAQKTMWHPTEVETLPYAV